MTKSSQQQKVRAIKTRKIGYGLPSGSLSKTDNTKNIQDKSQKADQKDPK